MGFGNPSLFHGRDSAPGETLAWVNRSRTASHRIRFDHRLNGIKQLAAALGERITPGRIMDRAGYSLPR
jgi:hypothetical protein